MLTWCDGLVVLGLLRRLGGWILGIEHSSKSLWGSCLLRGLDGTASLWGTGWGNYIRHARQLGHVALRLNVRLGS